MKLHNRFKEFDTFEKRMRTAYLNGATDAARAAIGGGATVEQMAKWLASVAQWAEDSLEVSPPVSPGANDATVLAPSSNPRRS